MPNHGINYSLLFDHKEAVEDLLKNTIAQEWIADIDRDPLIQADTKLQAPFGKALDQGLEDGRQKGKKER